MPGVIVVLPPAPAFFHGATLGLAWTVASYVAVALVAIILYEFLRSWVKRWLNRRLERNLRSFLETPDLYQQQFKFTNKLVVKHQLLADPEINEKILEFAERHDEDIEKVRAKVEEYVEEIVPSFNLFSYYRIGYPLARAVVHTLYDPVVDRERRRFLDALPPDAAPVFVMNHRSNYDFVLLAYVLAGKVSISYAVGEWARVWPLEHLFKSFGSYFVRRGYREDLYHKVLERYVQLIATHGVTQAIFPEGGLSRDGYLRPPKLGLITWLSRLEADREFKRNLVFVPIGVNYDRVIEDRHLVREARGIRKETRLWKKLSVLLLGPFTVIGLLLVNGTRLITGRGKLHGHASISFAEPLVLRDWLAARGVEFGACSEDERRRLIAEFANELMQRIGEAVPATPATLVATALLSAPERPWRFRDIVSAAHEAREALSAHGVRIVTGETFSKLKRSVMHGGAAEPEEPRDRPHELDELSRAIDRQQETELLVQFGLKLLRRAKIVRRRKGMWEVRRGETSRLGYYANSLAHRGGKRWESSPGEPAGPERAATAPGSGAGSG